MSDAYNTRPCLFCGTPERVPGVWGCGTAAKFDGDFDRSDGCHRIAALTARVEGLQQEFSDTAVKLADAEDRLAAVGEWFARTPYHHSKDELASILASDPEVIAVVDGWVQVGPDTVYTFVEDMSEMGDGYIGKPIYTPVTVTVTRKGAGE